MSTNIDSIPTAWDQFWLEPDAPAITARDEALGQLRWLTGAGVLIWFAGWLLDTGHWLREPARIAAATASELSPPGISQWLLTSGSYAFVPWIGLIATALWMFLPRGRLITAGVTLAALLAVFHRTAWVCGPVASLLSMLLYYQTIAADSGAWRATVGWRLIQLHLAALLLFLGLQQFRGGVWWDGEAMGWLISQDELSMANLKPLLKQSWLLQAITHACALFPIIAAGAAFTPWRKPVAWCGLAYGAWMALATGDAMFYVLLVGVYCILASSNRGATNWIATRRDNIGASGASQAPRPHLSRRACPLADQRWR